MYGLCDAIMLVVVLCCVASDVDVTLMTPEGLRVVGM